ncbi:cytochrome c biogenesis protein ResB [Salinibacterium sp. dk2585]|uniref:cytochrome c biogenesis protein ResB n=1 Tax=unclassified Salinibacterium TaxID=2632331 RepID=UPI0011C2426F|nr:MULTISPECIES: cytochrome c biogenesis protein ResB [unclassified Salinibacterium]QEE62356.1 cytochrome c biogenesis protein ResB [Salinibacterium sp. dk2585]TXK52761.1 cytochrome c biogenesis protein ResB [Salinibacterium sp. dk5596]
MSRPSDHHDSPAPAPREGGVNQPSLGVVGYLRFFWRQLTSMRTALVLLLLLALAAIPGSLVPQRSSDPNGVTQYYSDHPDLAPVLDDLQLFDVFGSVWFSAIYLLLFISLIGCVIPRTLHHLKALRTPPPKTPARLSRLEAYRSTEAKGVTAASAIESARTLLRKSGYRVRVFEKAGELSVSAERGYLRETGNLIFHTALIGVLVSVGIGGGFAYNGQKVVVEGKPFVNVLNDYDSFSPGRFFDEGSLPPYRLILDDFDASYETENVNAFGFASNFSADVTVHEGGRSPYEAQVRVNEPLPIMGLDTYLVGNGYAPHVTVTDADGNIAFTGPVPFIPQDDNLTSLGIIKVTDAVPEQIGMRGFFYPSAAVLESGALTSNFADLLDPVLTLNVYTGDLGLDDGTPRSVYSLNVEGMREIVGGDSGVDSIQLRPGESYELPGGRGTVTFDDMSEASPDGESVLRFASFDVHHDPSAGWVLVFTILVIGGLIAGLFVPRRRVWVKAIDGDEGIRLEYAGLARGEDPGLDGAVRDLAERHAQALGVRLS